MRRIDVASTSIRRHFTTIFPLGLDWVFSRTCHMSLAPHSVSHQSGLSHQSGPTPSFSNSFYNRIVHMLLLQYFMSKLIAEVTLKLHSYRYYYDPKLTHIGVGRFRILGGPRFRILGGPRGGQIPSRHMTS